ncbi:MAG: tRNA (guanosine(37)-N1)-methyltransferase TrmD [Fibromonadaceae bacterium]|jgi:tRNA (guanine37-N1)-methyltransferase|nr:tRNA (guanosine(37)-N1)-methyltransferase TrmD [Fibromonadaceae bacterium]
MKIDCITLFPEMFAAMNCSIMGRAQKNGFLDFRTVHLRDFAINDYGQVDDSPYGGEPGMVLRPEPLARAIDFCEPKKNNASVILLAADGVKLTHSLAKELSERKHLVMVCGHYKGVDERIRQSRVNLSVSVGDFVVSGGELPAMLLSDAIVRLIPGVIGDLESAETDSFAKDGKLGCPVWTRPQEFEGMKVPDILLSGHHENIKKWQNRSSSV